MPDLDDYEINSGKLFKYKGEASNITIPDGVTVIGERAFCRNENLTRVVIPEGVTTIGQSAFMSCPRLQCVVLPSSLKSIDNRAFYSCTRLSEIYIPDTVTSIGEQAFVDCISLKVINIPAGIKRIEPHVFLACASLVSITIPESITSIGRGAFLHCSKLRRIEIPSSVTEIEEDAFGRCVSVTRIETEVRIPDEAFGVDVSTHSLWVNNINYLPSSLKYNAIMKFAAVHSNMSSEREIQHLEYIRDNMFEFVELAFEMPVLLDFMFEHRLFSADIIDSYIDKARECSGIECVTKLLDYKFNHFSSEEVQGALDRQTARNVCVSEFMWNTTAVQKLKGKRVAVIGELSSFNSKQDFASCLDACGASWSVRVVDGVDIAIVPKSIQGGDGICAMGKKDVILMSEDRFNEMIGR